MLPQWLLHGVQRTGIFVRLATGHSHVYHSSKLLAPAEKPFGCLQVGVKRGGRRGPAFHRAKPFARELGRQMANLAQAGGNGQDAVMFLGSQGALLGAVQVRIQESVDPFRSYLPGYKHSIYQHSPFHSSTLTRRCCFMASLSLRLCSYLYCVQSCSMQ